MPHLIASYDLYPAFGHLGPVPEQVEDIKIGALGQVAILSCSIPATVIPVHLEDPVAIAVKDFQAVLWVLPVAHQGQMVVHPVSVRGKYIADGPRVITLAKGYADTDLGSVVLCHPI